MSFERSESLDKMSLIVIWGVGSLGKYWGITIMYLYLIVKIILSLRLIHFTAAIVEGCVNFTLNNSPQWVQHVINHSGQRKKVQGSLALCHAQQRSCI